MAQAYRIVNWKSLYEVTVKGKPANADTPIEQLRKSKLPYVRWAVHGHFLGATYRKMVQKAWGVGVLMEMACMGLFGKLLELAADAEPRYRGWILDEKHRPINGPQVADLLDIKDDGTVEKLMEILCDPEIEWLELVEFPLAVGARPGAEGRGGSCLGGKDEEPFKIETETEEEGKVIETERDSAPRLERSESSPPGPRPPDSGSGPASASEVSASASVSASAAGGGQGVKKRRAQAALELSEIISSHNTSDATTFRDILDHLEFRMLNETDLLLFDLALVKAAECSRFRVPAAGFVAAMKQSPFFYNPKGASIVRGKLDEYR